MYYTVIKHSDHLRTLDKCRKHSPAARVFYISLVFSNARRVLSQCNTRLRLLYLLNKTWVFDQSERTQGPIHVIKQIKHHHKTNPVDFCLPSSCTAFFHAFTVVVFTVVFFTVGFFTVGIFRVGFFTVGFFTVGLR